MKRDIKAIKDFLNKRRRKRRAAVMQSKKKKSIFIKNKRQFRVEKNIKKCEKLKKLRVTSSIVVYPSEKDFESPFRYLESLWNPHEDSTGVIKIIPPAPWKQVNDTIYKVYLDPNFRKSKNKMETRLQNLTGLLKGEKFKFIKNNDYEEYLEQSEVLEKTFYSNEEGSFDIKKREEDFWKICHGKDDFITSYAADQTYSNFLDEKTMEEISHFLKENKQWNLSTLYTQKDSLFQFLEKDKSSHISGLTVPWIYFGKLFATFCWHVEDLYMYSINYMYRGSPKVWYSISHNQKPKLDAYIEKKKLQLKINDPDILHKLILLVDPKELSQNNIKVHRTIQYPGEIIFTLPKAYHAGFSTGFNCAEAVNLATTKWISYGEEAIKDYQKTMSKMPVFPLEWLLSKNLVEDSNFSSNDKEKIKELFLSYYSRDLSRRKVFESFLTSKNLNFRICPIKDKTHYSKLECAFCTNYGYFSYLKCELCRTVKCLEHLKSEICPCVHPIITLFYRSYD